MATRSSARDEAPPQPESRLRVTFAKHTEAVIAVLLSMLVFGTAYVVRVLPQLRSIESQMQAISSQLGGVNESLARVEEHELFRLQLTAHGLSGRLESLGREAAVVDGELEKGATSAAELRRRLEGLGHLLDEATARLAPEAGPLPDLRREAELLSSRLEEARARVAPDDAAFPKLHDEALAVAKALSVAQARVGTVPDLGGTAASLSKELERTQLRLVAAREQLERVQRESKALADNVTAARRAADLVPCREVPGTKTLAALRRKGFCAK